MVQEKKCPHSSCLLIVACAQGHTHAHTHQNKRKTGFKNYKQELKEKYLKNKGQHVFLFFLSSEKYPLL